MKNKLSILLGTIFLVLIACEKSDSEYQKLPDGMVELKSEQLINANNEFAFDFFKEVVLAETTQNYMVSPVSLSLALGMAYNGSGGETKKAFEQTMGYDNWGFEQINNTNQNLIGKLVSKQEGNVFEVANSIWARDGFPVKNNFLNLNKQYYDAEVRSLDFSAPWALDTINGWVNKKTHEKIPTILDNIPAEAMLYIINALYFNANWKFEFDPDANKEVMFYGEGNTQKESIEMMATEAKLDYMENEVFSAVALPYKEGKYKMVLFKPGEDKSTSDIIDLMDGDQWKDWMGNMKETEKVQVTMPRFKFEYENKLNDEMINMGLGIAFSGQADFSGISDIPLAISMILQKTFIDVNEKGTEAAAVTIIGFETTAAIDPKPKITYFTLDKPFVFVITESESNAICFIGKIGKPEYKEE